MAGGDNAGETEKNSSAPPFLVDSECPGQVLVPQNRLERVLCCRNGEHAQLLFAHNVCGHAQWDNAAAAGRVRDCSCSRLAHEHSEKAMAEKSGGQTKQRAILTTRTSFDLLPLPLTHSLCSVFPSGHTPSHSFCLKYLPGQFLVSLNSALTPLRLSFHRG